ncbi:TPA: hypothetical protein N2P42_000470 [Klebsiella pneumoniae]|uniref:hypothetical protein n=1 Tax=Klebsiella pneumoniae TaxID=573 RepID=UPI0010352185|nr:hypothetical protein [Klebsiella pneumoniae]HBW4475387.1 hypothetical protein [Klebsiella pneumoniae]HBW4509325.1 hypothetical protein [Klebsiella pneumoniae]HBW4514286.1 hypothetical protein [Klebsiella pneumoniae]HBW4560151.1 hypothetical protein [Klebsiella pneumoniae]HBW4603424.1 hypothetical protein [Klebsiella pneumoniae]
MALVKVVRDNLISGANLQKLEVGAQVSVSGDVAKRWAAAGLVEIISDEDQVLEVATPVDDAAEQAEQQEESASKSKKAK